MLNRRSFLLAAAAVARAAGPNRRVAAQLSSVRRLLRTAPEKLLHDLAAIGYQAVEIGSRVELAKLAPLAKQTGLSIQGCVTETPLVTRDWERYPDFRNVTLPDAIDSLAAAGVETFIMGDISAGARGDGDDFYRRTADRMNDVAASCRKSGLRFAWQTQGLHFEGRPGLRPLDVFKDRLDQRMVPMELDVMRVSLAGIDPVALLREWKGHIATIRLLDRNTKARGQFEDEVPAGSMADLGDGALDFATISKAAQSAGIREFCLAQAPADDDGSITGFKHNFDFFRKLA